MKFPKNLDYVKVINQCVDTLLVGFVSTNLESYTQKYLPFLKSLESHKEDAQSVIGFDMKSRFVNINLLGLGHFKIYAQGLGAFAYRIENQDFTMLLGSTKFGANDGKTAQIRVEFRSHYLYAMGHKKAFDLVRVMVKKLMGEFNTQLLRIDLATDIQGIRYDGLDKYRIQTNFKKVDYLQINQYTKNNKSTGISIGGGAFMFRIYDKLEEIKKNPTKEFIKSKWIINGYNDKLKLPVFRHELQLRREELKKYFPNDIDCEVTFQFSQLEKIWNIAKTKVRWVDLSDSEVLEIAKQEMTSHAIKLLFQRVRKNESRLDFWAVLDNWDNKLATQIGKYENVKIARELTAEKHLKMFVGSTYKAYGSDPTKLLEVITNVQLKLGTFDNLTLHQHGDLKVLGSFVENARIIERLELNPVNDYSYKVYEKYFALNDILSDIKNPIMKSAKSYLNKRGLLTQNAS